MKINSTNLFKIIKKHGPISFKNLVKKFFNNLKNKNKLKSVIKKLKIRGRIISKNGLLQLPSVKNKNSKTETDNPNNDFLDIVNKHKIRFEFPEVVLEEVERNLSIPDKISENRVDCRNQLTVTIDGEDAKDLDDAVYLEKKKRGWVLFVHIADVSHYVKQNSSIDREAFKRGTSVYLVDKVVPMLPKELSNGICSLNQGEDRLCLSVKMNLSNTGKLEKYNFFESIINVKKRYTYKKVAEILEKKENELPDEDKKFYSMLKNMEKIANKITLTRFKKGSIDFDVDEIKIQCDDNSNPVNILRRERKISHRIIEEFMLKANKAAARFLGKSGHSIFRVHDIPDEEKIKNFFEFMRKLNYHIKDPQKVKSTYLQKILEDVRGTKNSRVVNTLLLRSMKQAIYHTENRGHYGLGFKDYTHFTSPIRRYPDLVIHRLIKFKLGIGNIKNRKIAHKPYLTKVAIRASKLERKAMEAERDMAKRKCARFLKKFTGNEFEAIVSGLTEFGIFVEIKPYGVEGLVPNKYLDGYFKFDEEAYILRGNKGVNYELGDKVKVNLINVNIKRGFIDFKIVK